MKTKTFNKKLFLNKETIAHLKVEEMSQVPGGFGITPKCWISNGEETCPPCEPPTAAATCTCEC
jgi:hypothetical protein